MKYELTENTKEVNGITLYQIRALKSLYGVKEGELGGYIQSINNLSQEGECWLRDNACVYHNARVSDNARLYAYARVFENAVVCDNSGVSGNARVYGNARIYGNAHVGENASVSGNSRFWGQSHVYGYAHVYGNAQVCGKARIYGNARAYENCTISGNARVLNDAHITDNYEIKNDSDYLVLGPFGNHNRFITYFFADKRVRVGCTTYDIESFEMDVIKKYGKNSNYYTAIKILKFL